MRLARLVSISGIVVAGACGSQDLRIGGGGTGGAAGTAANATSSGGSASEDCTSGSPCGSYLAWCRSPSGRCTCLDGIWTNCLPPETGGSTSSGAGGAGCISGTVCTTPDSLCQPDSNSGCYCVNGAWGNCFTWGPMGGAPASTGGAPVSIGGANHAESGGEPALDCVPGTSCGSAVSWCRSPSGRCTCLGGIWTNCLPPEVGGSTSSGSGGAGCVSGTVCAISGALCQPDSNSGCYCVNGAWGNCFTWGLTGGAPAAAGGSPGSYCVRGSECGPDVAWCRGPSGRCTCLGGIWTDCLPPETGGSTSAVGGSAGAGCVSGTDCTTSGALCQPDSNSGCYCVSGVWSNCFTWGPSTGGAPG
jgi:fibronectin-binding autotransporter adhesin